VRGTRSKPEEDKFVFFFCKFLYPSSHFSLFFISSFAPLLIFCSFMKHVTLILRCVITVVLSNNNNKLMVYIVKSTTIFFIIRLLLKRYNYMFRPSMLANCRLYMKHLTISYIYMWVGGFILLWDGVGARSRFVFVEGVWIVDAIHTPSTNTKGDLVPTPSHKNVKPHSHVDIAYR